MSEKITLRETLRLYRRLLSYTWPYKNIFFLAVFGMLVTSATEPGFAALMKPMLDGGFVQRDPASIRFIPLMLIGLFLVRGITGFIGDYAMSWVGRRVIYDLRNAMFAHLVHLPSSFYDANSSGILISKVIYDVEQVASAATRALSTVIKDNVTIVGLFVWMLYLNWQLTLMFVILGPAAALMMRAMSQRFRRTSWQIQESMGHISRVVQEAVEGQRVIKGFCGQETERQVFDKLNNRNRHQMMKRAAVSASGVQFVQLLAVFALASVVYLAMQQTATTVGSFVSYIAAVMLMMGPVRRLAQVNEIVQTGLAAADSVFELLDEPVELDKGTRMLDHMKGRVEYRNVSFRYTTGHANALSGLSFVIEPGQTLALVGPSGSGKSTIAALLPRFYPVTEGQILLDGIDIDEISLKNLRSHIAVVSQDIVLFDDTIRNNIAYAQENVTDEHVLKAADAAHVTEFVEHLPEGFETVIGENGVRLSGGQRQRIAIARAILKNAPILILDEATSSLDTASERHVQAAMQKLMENRTTLVIAHRLSTIEKADRILVLKHGRVVESGTHAELLARDDVYARLYRMQFNEPVH